MLEGRKKVQKNVDGYGGDFDVDGVNWEVKQVSNIDMNSKDPALALKRTMEREGDQSTSLFIDMVDQPGLTQFDAVGAACRAMGADKNFQQIRIVGKDFDVTIKNPARK